MVNFNHLVHHYQTPCIGGTMMGDGKKVNDKISDCQLARSAVVIFISNDKDNVGPI